MTSGDGKLRVGVVGVGWWGSEVHIPIFHDNDDTQVVAVCSRTAQRGETVAQQFGIPSVYTDFDQMLSQERLDVIAIATPNDSHRVLAVKAARAGKHIFCEKPLGMSYAEAREMYEAAKAAGVITMVCFTTRWLPATRLAEQIIRSGELGEIYHVNTEQLTDFGIGERSRLTIWRFQRERGGTGVLGDILSHALDRLRWWFGEISALTGQWKICVPELKALNTQGAEAVTSDDYCALLVQFESGLMGSLIGSRVATRQTKGIWTSVHASKGTLALDGDRNSVILQKVGEEERRIAAPEAVSDPTAYSFAFPTIRNNFVKAVREGREVAPSFADGLRVQALLEAAEKAIDERRWVDLDEIG